MEGLSTLCHFIEKQMPVGTVKFNSKVVGIEQQPSGHGMNMHISLKNFNRSAMMFGF